MYKQRSELLRVVLVIAFVVGLPVGVVAQDPPDDEIMPCEGDVVAGTVVDVDDVGMVTVETEAGLCTVMLEGEYEHPTYGLIGSYFGDVSTGQLLEALAALQGWAVQDEEGEWSWSEEEDGSAATVLSVVDNEDGTFTVEMNVEGQVEPVVITTEDAEWAAAMADALETLVVDWRLKTDDDGGVSVIEIADDVGGYHEDGIGFGVLVKVYAIAAQTVEACEGEDGPCGVTVEELIAELESGTGMGQLFEEYGKPSVTGVGHLKDQGDHEAVQEIQALYKEQIEMCRAEFQEAQEAMRTERKALQEQIRELRRSDDEDAEEQIAELQAQLEALEEEIEALTTAYEECLGDAEGTKEEAMSGLGMDDDDGDGSNGNGHPDKGNKNKDKKHGPPDHAEGWGPGGNPEGTDDD